MRKRHREPSRRRICHDPKIEVYMFGLRPDNYAGAPLEVEASWNAGETGESDTYD